MSFYLDLAKAFVAGQGPAACRRRVLPLKITVASTYHCNHRCKLCGVWGIYQRDPARARDELKLEDYERIFTELKDTLLYLDWTGGEPFIRPDIAETLLAATRICRKVASIVVTTNGLLTEQTVARAVEVAAGAPGRTLSVGVSLDGDASLHDEIRGREGAYVAAVKTVEGLRGAARQHPNLEVKLSYTLSSMNAGRFESFYEGVVRGLGLGLGDVAFNFEHSGNLYQSDATPAGPGEERAREVREGLQADLRWILDRIGREPMPVATRLKSFYRRHFLEGIPAFMANPKRVQFPCRAAWNSFFLDPYGKVYPCIIWNEGLGSFRDGIRSIAASDNVKVVRQMVRESKCPVCWNACEIIPSLLTSWRLVGCVGKSLF